LKSILSFKFQSSILGLSDDSIAMSESFFEFREKMVVKKTAAASSSGGDPMTVTQLTGVIERAIKSQVPASVLVNGEVSNFSLHRASGHLYFTLKDAGACIDCVMFKSDAQKVKFKPADGMELLAGGRVGIYAQRGRYQLYISSLSPIGQGALELAFQQLRAKLENEGLFAAERKKPLPRFPLNVALVTSQHTAALQDMLKVLRRYPFLKISLFHVPVQGEGAAKEIADAIGLLNRKAAKRMAIDLVVLARGGGSLEDLWQFNEEVVARAIAASRIPVITGVGHETDVSIADLVADYHAHTPTEAAQVVVAQWRSAGDLVETISIRSRRAMRQILQDARQQLGAIERHELFRRPMDRVNQLRQLLDDRQRSLSLAAMSAMQRYSRRLERTSSRLDQIHPRHRINLFVQRINGLNSRLNAAALRLHERRHERLNAMEGQLRALSPEAVLKRGYSITSLKKSGKLVRAAAQVKTGDRLITRFADGTVESVAEDQKQLPLFD
jgi:exodeoxyribonuclease VII large subunit